MDTTIEHSHSHDQDHDHEVSILSSYTPLLDHPEPESTTDASASNRRRPISAIVSIVASVVFLLSFIGIIVYQGFLSTPAPQPSHPSLLPENLLPTQERLRGVSQKSNGRVFDTDTYNWTDAMQDWQRSAYHFQPVQNWMNDPSGPLFHMGWYHLFYQYNPDSAVSGNITWGHAVSRDMIHWLYLPIAMTPDAWYDWHGIWTGSATLLPDGQIIILYTGESDNYVQVQNLAYPANLSDPLLLDWVKYADNPVMVPSTGIAPKDFRDPTTAWVGPDGSWRIVLGSKLNTTGFAFVYKTDNFTSYELLDGVLHAVPTTGMWECVDFYPVATNGSTGLDTSASGPGLKHVIKASIDDDKHDYYAIGTYDIFNNTWTPDNVEEDLGFGMRLDYGKYYASKTFYDQNKKRRILLGWVGETDSEEDDRRKGWASVQSFPRNIVYDNKTGTNILQWPIEEIESLRLNSTDFEYIELSPGQVVPLDIGSVDQLDIVAEFVLDQGTLNEAVESDVGYNCSAATERGALGPFGLLVIADDSLTELTPVYFYIAKVIDGSFQTFFCTDQTRSSLATSVGRLVYGGKVTVVDGETLSMRLLVDHSVVEGFAQGGRTVITSRIYPTQAIYGSAKLFLFNNATNLSITTSLTVWQMDSAYLHAFPKDQM